MNTPPFPDMVVESAYDLLGQATATLSINRKYRYTLTRTINPPTLSHPPLRDIVWLMLNPSTADAMADDPTVRRTIGFSRRAGAGIMHVVNLYALRSTDPDYLTTHADPTGPWNDQLIDWQIADAHKPIIVAAWGAHPAAEHRAAAVLDRVTVGHDVHCLGVTRQGYPKHPSRLAGDVPLRLYRAQRGVPVATPR
jgi:hypothetical protein